MFCTSLRTLSTSHTFTQTQYTQVRVLVSTQTESREFLDLMFLLSGERSSSVSREEEDKTLSEERRVMGSIARLRLASMFDHEKKNVASRHLLDRAVHVLPNSITTRSIRPPHLLNVLVRAAESHEKIFDDDLCASTSRHNETSLRYRRLASSAFPSSYKTQFMLGTALLRQGFYGEAVLQLRAAVKLNDRSIQAHHACAVALHRTRKYVDSLSHFDAAIELMSVTKQNDASVRITPYVRPNNLRINNNKKQVYFDRGSVLDDLNRLQLAADSYIRAIEIDPTFSRSFLSLGQLLLRDGQLEAAEDLYRQLLSNVPNDVDALIALAQIFERQSLVSRAARAYERVLKSDPHHVGAAERRVAALQRIGHYGSAENTLESLILTLKMESDRISFAHRNRSTCNNEDAIQPHDESQELFREIRRLQDTLLITREKRVATDEALELLEQSRELAAEGQSSVALVHAKAALKIVRTVVQIRALLLTRKFKWGKNNTTQHTIFVH